MVIRGRKHKQSRTGVSPAGPRRQSSRLVIVISALLALEAAALGLKAWEEKQTRDFSRLESLQREAEALAERLDGQIATTRSVIELAQKAGAGRGLVTDTVTSVDVAMSLREAAGSADGSRAKSASHAAINALAQEQSVSLSDAGDVVFLVEQTGFPATLALAPAESWLPAPRDNQRFTLVADRRIGRGNADLTVQAETATTRDPQIQSGEGLVRAATACTTLTGTTLQACVTRATPSFTQADLFRLLAYALLLAAPLLAILGLLRQVLRKSASAIIVDDQELDSVEQILSSASAGSWSWNPRTGEADLGLAAARLLGLPAAGTYGVDELLTRVPEREYTGTHQALEDLAGSGWIQHAVSVNTDSARAFVEFRAKASQFDGEEGVFRGIILDVTEQKLSDLRLRKAEKRLRAAIESYSEPFALWDERKRLLYWNRSFADTFSVHDTLRPGISRDTVDIARAPAIRGVKQLKDVSAGEMIELHSGHWLKMVERETTDGGSITIGVDVTETVRSENLLERQKRKLKMVVQELEVSEGRAAELARDYAEAKAKAEHAANTKSAFLANMSHELRTPLNAINGFSEILTEELYGPLGDEKYRGYAKDILTSGQHLLDLINDILDMAKIEAGKMSVLLEPLDPVDPVDAAIRMIRRKAEDKNISIVLDAPMDLPQIEADHRAIRQMVLNLISNALKFTDSGGRITVAIRVREDQIQISVIDTGIGIPRDQISRLGRPFEQISETRDRNYDGTGLGLALTKSFAEMHGGRIAIASEVGKGTRVSIYLPLPKADEAAIPDLSNLGEAEPQLSGDISAAE